MLGVPQADCDALSTSQRLDAATLRDLRPAHSLDAAAEVLSKHGIKYVRSQGVLPLDGLSERELHNIATLPQGEPIILPADEGSAICVLRPSADSICRSGDPQDHGHVDILRGCARPSQSGPS
jgi:hypothetical protein